MKILTLLWSVGKGGGERAAVNFAIGYKQFRQDSKVLVLGEGTDRLPDLEEADVETSLYIQSENKEDVLKKFKDWAPDIIQIHAFDPSLLPYIEKIKASHTKVVETNVFSRPQYGSNYKIVSLSMQLTKWGYWKYKSWMKRADHIPQIAIVPNIVRAEKFSVPDHEQVISFLAGNEIPAGAFVIGRLGQQISSKWDEKIIRVIEETVKPDNNIFYFFVGAPANLEKKLEATSRFIQSRVKLVAEISGDENLSLYYHSLSCFAHMAKIGESFGYVLTEAMLSNVPVVTLLTPLNDNGQYEVVGNHIGGVCVTTVKEFIRAIKNLHEHPEEIKRLQNNNLPNWVTSRFSAEAVIPEQLKYYSQILEGKNLPEPGVSGVVKEVFSLYGYKAAALQFLSGILHRKSTHLFLKKLKGILH